MKKTILTLAIVLGLALGASAQWGGGLFQRGAVSDEDYYGVTYGYQDRTTGGLLNLPGSHGETDDQNGAPLGSGALLLIGFGVAYAMKKRKNA